MAPFSLQEAEQFLDAVADEYYSYYVTRFFTVCELAKSMDCFGMTSILRTKQLRSIRRWLKVSLSGLKTQGSHRVIHLIDRVVEALKAHKRDANLDDKFVFINSKRKP